jgi:hypothetical protein
MTHNKYTTKEIASALEKLACDIRDGKEYGCIKIKEKTAGYWAYDNPNNNEAIEETKKINQWE